jgi:CRISPR system Cascade subunit CasB
MTEKNPATEPTAPRWATLGVTGTVVDAKLKPIQEGYLANGSASVAALARLRRGIGKPPGALTDILGYTLDDELAGSGDDPTPGETAAHISITLYALHQQSQGARMHCRGYGLGRSVRLLHPHTGEPKDGDPVLRRFNALGTSDGLEELTHHLRGMVQLLRGKRIPLDYGLLADQLTHWPRYPDRIRLRWGREFYRAPSAETPEPITRS